MPTPPPKFKPVEQWSPEEHLDHLQGRGEPIPEEFRSYKRQALEAAGLHDEADAAEKPDAEKTPEDWQREFDPGRKW